MSRCKKEPALNTNGRGKSDHALDGCTISNLDTSECLASQVVVPKSRYSPLSIVRHSFPKPFQSDARVIATATIIGTEGIGAQNGSWTVTIRSVSNTQFSANVYRADASTSEMTDGWDGRVVLHYIAWGSADEEKHSERRRREPEGVDGVFFGSWYSLIGSGSSLQL